jgi:uncharacterized Zn finger protein (UPF0148 family)
MTDTSATLTCKACGRPIVQQAGGHRKREYCDPACKMRDRRNLEAREKWEQTQEALRARWGDFLPETFQALEEVMHAGSVGLTERVAQVIASEISAATDAAQTEMAVLQQQVAVLERRLTAIQDIEERFRTDTEARAFKTWLAKHARYYAETPFGQRFLEKYEGMPPRGSRAWYEQLLRNAHYSAEDIATFREAWKAMILAQS